MIQYANKDNLIIPTGGVLPYEDNENDWIFGSSQFTGRVLMPGLNWKGILEEMGWETEIQKTSDGQETFLCVTFADTGTNKIINQRIYSHPLDCDEKFLGIGSGTVEGRGNSIQAVLEFERTKGFLYERKDVVNMTYKELWVKPTESDYAEAENNLKNYYSFNYEFLERKWNGIFKSPDCSLSVLLAGFAYSPLMVTVDARYDMDDTGMILGYEGKLMSYNHEIINLGPHFENTDLRWFDAIDSETKQLLRIAPDYRFGWPVVKYLQKKNMKIYRKRGQKAIGYVNELGTGIYLWADGQDNVGPVAGGSTMKSLGLKYEMAEACDEWPLPIIGQHTIKPIEY